MNPDDYASLGAFDPTASVVIDTDALTIDGVGVAATTVSLDTGSGAYDVAVFTFDSFELDAGLTLTGTGSLPLAILSQGDLSVLGTIDVSAFAEFPVTTTSGFVHGERLAGAGGGDGASVVQGSPIMFHGEAAVGAPTALGVQGFGEVLVMAFAERVAVALVGMVASASTVRFSKMASHMATFRSASKEEAAAVELNSPA